jgi:acetylornithine deacetylase/succinyl-diaminopimelate desuccinylase-like protein
MAEQGVIVEKLEALLKDRKGTIPKKLIQHLAEVHIEQEDTLAEENKELGVITDVRGSVRYGYVKFVGEAAHSGTRKQKKRKDAILIGAKFITELDKALFNISLNHDLVWSFGDTRVVGGGSQTTVSPNNELLFDIRSSDEKALKKAHKAVIEIAEKIARKHNVKFEHGKDKVIIQKPTIMSVVARKAFAKILIKLGIKFKKEMISGAGHDCAITQEAGIPSTLLFMRHRGGSHNKDERMTVHEGQNPIDICDSYAKAVKALVAYASSKVLTVERALEPSRPDAQTFMQKFAANDLTRLDMAA